MLLIKAGPLRRLFCSFLILLVLTTASLNLHAQETASPVTVGMNQCVVVLHGLFRTDRSMRKVAKILMSRGYRVVNQSYPSRKKKIETLALEAIPRALEQCSDEQPQAIHFVTHSMGGILVRYYLSHYDIPQLGHVIMLGPPNQGSEIVDRLDNIPLLKNVNGPAGLQLGTKENSLPRQLGPVDYSVGIIAGRRSTNFILSSMLPGRDDGKVSLESTRVEGMRDYIEVNASHTFIMNHKDSLAQILYFLANGHFQHPTTDSVASQTSEIN